MLDELPVLLIGRGGDAGDLTPGEGRLEHAGDVAGPLPPAGAHDGMHLVDEEHDAILLGLGAPLTLAVLLGSIAGATDPAACADVVHEGSADGPFARTLLGIVAIDDAWGLIAFVVALAVADAIAGGGGVTAAIGDGTWEMGGAILVGAVLGLPLAYLTGRLRPGEPTLLEALGAVFVCCGVAMLLHVTYLLAAMVMGMVVANLARHHRRPFHAIEGIEWPAMVLFFVLAGASLHLATLAQIGWIGAAYVVLRIVGRLVGGWAGARLSGAPVAMQRWMGLALLPQAGVALGMALLASERFPELRQTILPVAIAATVLFELSGPVLTRLALVRAGEMRSKRP